MPTSAEMTATVAISAILALMMLMPAAEAQMSYTPRDLVFTVYNDGVVAVEYAADVDPTRARVNLTLFGSLYQDLLVEDEDGLPLDHSPRPGGLTVDTLGSTAVLISYATPDLTSKSARVWVFSVSTPVASSVLLPAGSTVVGLNVVPLAVGSVDGRPLLTMPGGQIEIAFIVSVEGTREHALALLKDAESTVKAVKASGVAVGEAESLLQQAQTAFGAGRYIDAERLSGRAKAEALGAEAAAFSAKEAQNTASASISAARNEGRTSGLDRAEGLLLQAEDAFRAGDYARARTLALGAKTAAEAATVLFPYAWIALGLAGAALGSAAVYSALRRRPGRPEDEEPGMEVDLEALFERNPDLRLEDKEALRFLAESGGEAFAAEVRERFDIPRTSAWRLIRRLQKKGMVEVRNVGGQNLVRIRSRYRVERGDP